MIKLRLQGLPDEIEALADALEATGAVLERSDAYANRGTSKYARIYLDMEWTPNKELEVEQTSKLLK